MKQLLFLLVLGFSVYGYLAVAPSVNAGTCGPTFASCGPNSCASSCAFKYVDGPCEHTDTTNCTSCAGVSCTNYNTGCTTTDPVLGSGGNAGCEVVNGRCVVTQNNKPGCWNDSPVCGNLICESGELCDVCADCGQCGCTPNGSCSDNGTCGTTCTDQGCGVDNCGVTCRWGMRNCGGGNTPPPPPTAPTNPQCIVPTVQQDGNNSFNSQWTLGSNGNQQFMRMDIDDTTGRNDANYGCPSGSGQDPGNQTSGICIVKDDAVGVSTTNYAFQQNLVSGQTYYWRIVNIETTTGQYADAMMSCRTCPVKTNPIAGTPACDNMYPDRFDVHWTAPISGVTNFDTQVLRVDTSEFQVDNGCPSGCVYKNDTLSTTATVDTATGLTPNNSYWVRVAGVSSANPSCWKDAKWQCRLPGGNIQGRAVAIPDDQPTCPATYASSTYLDQTQISFSPSVNPASINQNGSSYATWNNVFATTYTISAVPPDAGWVQKVSCWAQPGASVPSGTGNSAALEDTRILTWDMGYSPPGPWWQAVGGDVYGKNGIVSAIPTIILPRAFNLSGIGEYPGVVTMGSSSYDFAVENFGGDPNGRKLVNALDDPTPDSKNWLVTGDSLPQDGTNLYSLYYTRFGSPTSPTFGGGAKPTSGVYYANGNVDIDQDWALGVNDSIVIFVNGTLTIKNPITNPTGSGFVVFITSAGISIDPTVGGAYNSNAATIEGVYITSGIFDTGLGAIGKERLIAKGVFLANSVKLSRNLKNAGGGTGQNINYPAQQFIYDPGHLVRMPASMTEIAGSTTWQEVAP